MEWKAGTSTEPMECASIGHTSGPWIDPHVEPVEFSNGPEGEVVVEVHQVVCDLNGNLSRG